MERFRDHICGTLGAGDFLATLMFYFLHLLLMRQDKNTIQRGFCSTGLNLTHLTFVSAHKFILARTPTDQPMFSIRVWTHMELFGFKHYNPFPFRTLQFFLEIKSFSLCFALQVSVTLSPASFDFILFGLVRRLVCRVRL